MPLQSGEMGEQIIVSGLDVQALEPGTRLQLGAGVVEINELRTGCSWFEQVQGKSAAPVKGKVGVMASVIEGGAVKVGDAVKVVEKQIT